jgi:Ser/Thr protein kinase RdoA (MazF antagonist)
VDEAGVEGALSLWAETEGGRATLINVSENHTYRIETPAGTSVLRLHRPGYQSRETILSELAWVAALRELLPVPRPLPGRDGALLQEIAPGRSAVLFAFEPGREPSERDDLAPLFKTLGKYAAVAHQHVEVWAPPDGFVRQSWTIEAFLDPDGLWGDWRVAPGVEGDVRATIVELDGRLRERLTAYGGGANRFGLIHADMRLANVLVDADRVTLIDFDDSGFCWFLYDLAASLSFIETRPDLSALIDAWIEGYTGLRPLSDEDLDMVEPMILLRRMALLAWIGSHGETPLASRHAPRFAADTAALARRFRI